MPLKAGIEVYLPPKGKLVLDTDDKVSIRKASYKKQQKKYSKNRKPIKKRATKKTSIKKKKRGVKI
jgi:hypothetical protein